LTRPKPNDVLGIVYLDLKIYNSRSVCFFPGKVANKYVSMLNPINTPVWARSLEVAHGLDMQWS
jgi:hypothetical protein